MITPEHEQVRPPTGPGFSESVTFSWGDQEQELFGSARLGLAGGGASALGLLFAGGELASSSFEGGEPGDGVTWEEAEVGDVSASVEAPLGAWTVSYDGDGGAFDLRFEALSAPLVFGADRPVARVARLEGYEQLCRVTGTVRADGATRTVEGLGQRGHQWGRPDWERMSLTRSVSAWCGPDRAVALAAVRPDGAPGHAQEAVDAYLVHPGPEEPAARPVDDARLSTTYDAGGRQRRAGIELWPDEDGPPLRAAGEVACGTSLELGRGLLHASFFTWRMEGARGVGRYDVLVKRP